MMTWLVDANGNKCSVKCFGSLEAAQKALDSLVDCKNCVNCSGCSDCSRCSGCRGDNNRKSAEDDFQPPSVPVIENINQRLLEAVSAPEALDMSDWHTCGTTHCRAGWVVHLAGEEGYALERFHNTAPAAQLICAASGSPISPVRFYEGNEPAMADIRRMAGVEDLTHDKGGA